MNKYRKKLVGLARYLGRMGRQEWDDKNGTTRMR
jgi:hypothetical protein